MKTSISVVDKCMNQIFMTENGRKEHLELHPADKGSNITNSAAQNCVRNLSTISLGEIAIKSHESGIDM